MRQETAALRDFSQAYDRRAQDFRFAPKTRHLRVNDRRPNQDRSPTYGYAESREATMAAFAAESRRRGRRHALPPALPPITVRGDVSWHARARREDI